jgi:hypothetical protein
MNRHRSLAGGGRPRMTCSTSFGHATAKAFRPNCFEQGAMLPLRRGRPHRQYRRPISTVGRRPWACSAAGLPTGGRRTHVPEIAADKIALTGIVVQNGASAYACDWGLRSLNVRTEPDRPGRPVQFRHGTREACLGHVTESTSFIAIHRQMPSYSINLPSSSIC